VIGVRGGEPYSRLQSEATRDAIDKHLKEWLNELNSTDEEAVLFI
jgi:hypothetical protein